VASCLACYADANVERCSTREFTLWERSCRVVLMVAAPGMSRTAGVWDRTVELLDLYPTLIELCGLPPRKQLEGRSLRPLLKSPNAVWDKAAVISDGPEKMSVRTQPWRYTRKLARARRAQ
jgi:arylsulfatase A-like enzyme